MSGALAPYNEPTAFGAEGAGVEASGSRRKAMVDGQILPNNVTDEGILAAFLEVAREPYVPRALRAVAYVDDDLRIAPGRHLLAPVVLARLLQAAAIGPEDAVLDVGCASGYSTAVLARLASAVVALESDGELAGWANRALAVVGIDNAAVVEGALEEGCAEQGPYDVIVVNGATGRPPEALVEQLSEGGRMVLVSREGEVGRAMLYRRRDGVVSHTELFDAQVPVLPGLEASATFRF